MRPLLVAALALLCAFAAVLGARGGEPAAAEPLFATAATCAQCHANSPEAGAMRDEQGRGIAPHDLWEGTMMANAARDPFFRAAMAAEVAATPARRAAIEAKCLHCHAPMASVGARRAGRPGLSRGELAGELASDGVSCTLCHQILPDGLGEPASFNGGFRIGDMREIFGPHGTPWGLPMHRITRYWPVEGAHMLDSGLCGTCHTVLVDQLDASGNETGLLVPEQTVYLEWRNSIHAAQGRTCQDCHLPRRSEGGQPLRTRIARSTHGGDIVQLDPREPFGRHVFVGGNTLVPALLRDHAEALGVTAPPAAFDRTIAAARQQLEQRTARLSIEEVLPGADGLEVSVRIENLAGHKFPSGHPSRRAWLRVRVTDDAGRVLFSCGEVDVRGRLVDGAGEVLPSERRGGPVEPHRTRMGSATDVVIWEAVMRDGAGEPVFAMLRAAGPAKDNRLLPAGWRADHPDAPMAAPAGVGDDADFMAGSDRVDLRVPLAGLPETCRVEVELLFQPLGARFLDELLAWDLPEVRALAVMLDGAAPAPEVIARAAVTVREQ